MSYINAYIEKCSAFGWQGGPVFKTQIVTMASGREKRNGQIAEARHAYSAPFQNINQSDYANIKQMHLVCRGQLHAFRFRDELDFEADAEVFAVADGVETEFQLRKVSTVDGVTYNRNVYALRSVVVTANGAPSAPTIDMDRGLAIYGAAPANGTILRWSGEFDIWVRFNQDDLPFSIDNRGQEGSGINGVVDLIEVPPPEEVTS